MVRALISVIPLVMGVALVWWSIAGILLGNDSVYWPAVEGAVVRGPEDMALLYDAEPFQPGEPHPPRILYEYQVGEDTFQGDQIRLFDHVFGRMEDPEMLARRYPEGMPVQVHFDPGYPPRAVIQPGVPGPMYGVLAMGVLLTAGAIYGIGGGLYREIQFRRNPGMSYPSRWTRRRDPGEE